MFTILNRAKIASTTLLSIAVSLPIAGPSFADVHNPNVSVGKAELRAKCRRAGGDWKVEKNGTYRCVVHTGGDDITVVECSAGKCDGYIFDSEKVSDRRRRGQAIIAPNNLMAMTPAR